MSADILALHHNEREALLARIISALQADARVIAAWLTGSLARGSADALSDIDIWVIVANSELDGIKASKRQFIASLGDPVLIEEAPQNAPPGGAYLLVLYSAEEGPQQVDWYWQAESVAAIPHDAFLLFDRVGLPHARRPAALPREQHALEAEHATAYFWAMVNICAKKIVRREAWTVLSMLNIVWQLLQQVRWHTGDRPTQPTHREAPPNPPPINPQEQLTMLCTIAQEMEGLSPMLQSLGVEVPTEAIKQIYQLIDIVSEADPNAT